VGSVGPVDEGLKSLMELGFSEIVSRTCLRICDGDVHAALELALSK